MFAGKSHGSDNFATDFFHSCWYVVKYEVWVIVEESRQAKGVLLSLNSTFFTLIPKEEPLIQVSFDPYPYVMAFTKSLQKS